MGTPSSSPLSRRQALKVAATLLVGSALAACGAAPTATPVPPTKPPAAPAAAAEPTKAPAAVPPPPPTNTPVPAPTKAPASGKVVIMHKRAELSEAEQAQFEKANPTIKMELIEIPGDNTRFYAMYAAGAPPDLLRTQAPAIPNYLARKMLKDLSPFFEISSVLKPADLAAPNNYYRATSPTSVGTGSYYGMCKDWSPDFTLFLNKKVFADAGVTVPDDTKSLTYDDIFALATKLTKMEGNRTVRWGYGYGDWWVDRIIMNMIAEKKVDLYADNFTKIVISGNDVTKAAFKYYYDIAKANVVANPLNPSPTWNGEDFTKGTIGILQYGYWYSASAESDITKGQVVTLPAPTWAGVRRDPTITATGMVMTAPTKVPEAAWKVFEWYNGQEPAVTRAKSGWGVPPLKSFYSMMPKDTPYAQQVQKVLQGELTLETPPLQFNPFIGESTVADTFAKYLQPALKGDITFEQMIKNIETDINAAIKDGVSRMAG